MWTAEHTVETKAPRETIWRLWENVPGWREWDDNLDRARWIIPSRLGRGAKTVAACLGGTR